MELANTVREDEKTAGQIKAGNLAIQAGTAFTSGVLTDDERQLAIEVLKWLASHTEVEVRRNLAEHIKSSPLLPHSIALTLAQDIETVATPILEKSLALTDSDLIAIIENGNTAKQRAIAKREVVSDLVSGALVDTGKQEVVSILLANPGADISESSYRKVLGAFAENSEIQERLVDRKMLPFAVQERLIAIVSDDLQERLIEKHSFPLSLAEQFIRQGRERALVQSLSTLKKEDEIEAAAMRIYLKGSMTPTLLLRALAAGQLELFGASIATLARIPSAKARQALREKGTPALCGLYQQSHLPEHLQKAFQVMLENVLRAKRAGAITSQAAMEEQIIDDLIRAYRRLSPDSLESVIFQLSRLDSHD